MKLFGSILILFLFLLVGCNSPDVESQTTSGTPYVSPAPINTAPSSPGSQLTTPTVTANNVAQVVRVIDGDTIEVSMNGRTYTVRYIGMDTPETVDPNKPVQPFGVEASNKNKELVSGKTIRLEKDVSETDRYGRLLRYVYVGDLFVNAELVKLGYAQVATYPPDVKYVDLFLQLQREARETGRGLWATSTTTPTQTASPNTPLPLRIISVTTPVKPGGKATLIAETTQGATCTITVYYKSGPSSASGLGSKQADSSGRVSWTWTVGTNTTPGTYRIVVAVGGINTETTFTVQ